MSQPVTARLPHAAPRRGVALLVGAVGISAMVTQLVLMREMLAVFSGNELVLGVLLGNWLLATGLGSFLGRTAGRFRRPMVWLVAAEILVAVLPPVQVYVLRLFPFLVFTRGAMIGAMATAATSFGVLLPFCLVSGFVLTAACAILLRSDERAVGKVYLADAVGSVIGGVAFSFLLVWWLDHFVTLYLVAAVNLLLAGVLAWRTGARPLTAAAAVGLAGVVVLAATVDLDAQTTRLGHVFEQVLFAGNSPYGRVVVTQSAGQVNVFSNGLPVATSGDVQGVEETVHYAMAQRPEARQVLLIGGGASGAAREVLKYPTAEVTVVELDPLMVELTRRFLPEALADERINVVTTDGRQFVRRTDRRFDVVILDVPEPATAQINRFYTAEFFAAVKRRLAAEGVLSLTMGQFDARVGPELARMLAVTRRTLETAFANVVLIPGGKVVVLASDGPLDTDIAARLEAAGIKTKLVNRYYLDAMLTPDRQAAVEAASSRPAAVNEDFRPVLYFDHLRYWTAQFRTRWVWPAVVAAAALAVYLARMRAVPFAIFADGFAAAAGEVVLLLGFQVSCGSVYSRLAVLVTVFMVALAVGAGWANRVPLARPRRALAGLAMGIGLFAVAIPPILRTLAEWAAGPLTSGVVVAAMVFVLAVLVGAAFAVAGRSRPTVAAGFASRLYVADFVGACAGALLASAVLIPLAGLTVTCALAGGLCVMAAILVRMRAG